MEIPNVLDGCDTVALDDGPDCGVGAVWWGVGINDSVPLLESKCRKKKRMI